MVDKEKLRPFPDRCPECFGPLYYYGLTLSDARVYYSRCQWVGLMRRYEGNAYFAEFDENQDPLW
jgi:hypothetical protein